MENKSHALAAGSFVLLMLALVLGSFYWLNREGPTQRRLIVVGRVNVAGLQPQAAVRYRGVAVGKVDTIRLAEDGSGQVEVTLALDARTPITAHTTATLGFQGLTGLAHVALDDPPGDAPLQPDAGVQRIPLRPGLVSRLSEQGEYILGQVAQGSERLNDWLAPAQRQALLGAVNDLAQTARALRALSEQTRAVVPGLAQDSHQTLLAVQDSLQRLGQTADATRALVQDLRQLSQSLAAPGGTLDRVAQSADALNLGAQALRRSTLPQLDRAVDSLTLGAQRFESLAARLEEQPQSLLWGPAPTSAGPGEPGFQDRP
ncbi:MAG: MlaD family protein [Rhodoferax sp.]